jgi:hypothetical protein
LNPEVPPPHRQKIFYEFSHYLADNGLHLHYNDN